MASSIPQWKVCYVTRSGFTVSTYNLPHLVSQFVPSLQPARETAMISEFLFCARFIAAKTTERPLNSKTQADRCGSEPLPAVVSERHGFKI